MKYGVDITSARLDDLDKHLLDDVRFKVSEGQALRVLDVGCGRGGLSMALVAAGASVVAVDIHDYQTEITENMTPSVALANVLQFVQGDIAKIEIGKLGHFDIVVMQRVLHYLPYQTAKVVLRSLREHCDVLYLAVTGVETAIGRHYDAASQPVTERFGVLDSVGQESFSISAPVCLYTDTELDELLRETGWKIEWSRVSDFGNIKVIAVQK